MNRWNRRRHRTPAAAAVALALWTLNAGYAGSLSGQSSLDLLHEISTLAADTAVAFHHTRQIMEQLGVLIGSEGLGRDLSTSPDAGRRGPFIDECCTGTRRELVTSIHRMRDGLELLNRNTSEYQLRSLALSFGAARVQLSSVVEALGGLEVAGDSRSLLRTFEQQFEPALQALRASLEDLERDAGFQLADFPIYLLGVGPEGTAMSPTFQGAPGASVEIPVRLVAALAPGPVYVTTPVWIEGSVPGRFESRVAFPTPLSFQPGQLGEGVFTVYLEPIMADEDIPLTIRALGDFPRQHRGLMGDVVLRIRAPN